MSSRMENLKRLLSYEEDETEGEVFDLVYRGSSEIDRHYTKPMLPWIISEIKNQHKMLQVTVTIKSGFFVVEDRENKKVILTHTVRQIHKCLMEQADHRCFLYTLRAFDKETSSHDGSDASSTPLPCNISTNQNYFCHLYQALTKQEVRSFFSCLRQQPREEKLPENDSLNALADLSVHTESQFFEVLFVGRVKVSHCKLPVTFIDEALVAFKRKEKDRKRHTSGEGRNRVSPSRVVMFQQEGSGYSVPNVVLRNLCGEDLLARSRSSSRDFSPGSADAELGGYTYEPRNSLSKLDETPDSSKSDLSHVDDSSVPSSGQLLSIEPLQRMRSVSTSEPSNPLASDKPLQQNGQVMRARSGSMGSALTKQSGIRPSEVDLKALGSDFNRTMLFHIGHREIQLINPELKSVQLHKPFKDVAECCQGMKANDHFGFICRELCGDVMVYVGYIFRCDRSSVADEIMQVLNRSFSAMHEAHQKERKEHLMCDFCPLKWFSQLCADAEGLPAAKAHSVIMKRVSALPDEERETIIAKYEGAETSELVQKNNVLMMLLRTHFEYKQMNHSHPSESDSGYQRSESLLGANLEESLKKAKKSIATSFNHLLKKREGDSAEREIPRPEVVPEHPRISPVRTTVPDEKSIPPREKSIPPRQKSPPAAGNSCFLEGISVSPLRTYRSRSSTISGAGGDSMRKEVIAKRALSIKKEKEEKEEPPELEDDATCQKNTGPKMNIFLKFGPPSSHGDESLHEKEAEYTAKPPMSFRQSILQKVVSPSKGMRESPNRKVSPDVMGRKISTGMLGKRDNTDIQDARRRKPGELKVIWKKAVFQQILLLRIEKENQRLRALQKEAALQRVRLNYEEEELPIEAQQTWELMLSRPNARIDSNVLYSGIKQGVPKLVRGEVWNLLMVQRQMFHQVPRQKQNHPKFFHTAYEDMIKELTSQQHAILIDLGRTFPGHPYFTQTLGPGQLALFNILKAYSILDPEVGYCQGLSFLGGVLLLHVEEELAYHLFKYLMFDKGCRKQYKPDLDGLQIRMYQLSRLLHDKLRELYEHLEEHEVTPQLYAAPWFLTMFASQFPLNFVARAFDLLFLIGMEAIFCVALVLLQTHEQDILSLRSFEQIMEYFKTTMPNIQTSQLGVFFAEVCECNVKDLLSAYEVEYQVLQEELFFPQQDANINKLKEASKNLKRQNLDLLEQLHSAKVRQQSLESSNQSLQQSQHHLEVRVRWLEMEKNNMRQLIDVLSKNATKEMFEAVPPNLERYLPHKASSPRPEERRYSRSVSPGERHSLSPRSRHHSLKHHDDDDDDEESTPTEINIQVPRHQSFSPIRTIDEQPAKTPTTLQPPPQSRPRSSTLDPKSMQTYFKNFIKAE